MLTDQQVERYRREFAIVDECTFLNHAANAPDSLSQRNKLVEFLNDAAYGNLREERWFEYAERTRENLAHLLGAHPDEITYVQNVSSAAGLIANGLRWRRGDNIVTPRNQFPSNIYPWLNLRARGVEVRLIDLPRDETCYDVLCQHVDRRTRLISLCFVEYEDGFRHDLGGVGTFCRENGILFFVDGAQGVGAFPIDVRRNYIDFLATTGVKWLLGPNGQGMLYIRKELLESLYVTSLGWLSVQAPYDFTNVSQTYKGSARRFEGGGSNLMGIAGLGASVELLLEVGIDTIAKRILNLTESAAKALINSDYRLRTNMMEKYRSGILSFYHPMIHSNALFSALKNAKVIVSERNGVIRISPHFYNNHGDIDQLIYSLPKVKAE